MANATWSKERPLEAVEIEVDDGSGEEGEELAEDEAGLIDGVLRGLPFLHFGLDGEIDHQDGVLFDDADEKNDADDGDHGKFDTGEAESEKRADTGGRNGGKNGDG